MPIHDLHLPGVQEIITRAGFEPTQVYDKPDPRGPEYGSFRVAINQATDLIDVEYMHGNDLVYQIKVSPKQFATWAQECT